MFPHARTHARAHTHTRTHAHTPDEARANDEAGGKDGKVESARGGAALEQALTEALRWVLPVEGFGQGFRQGHVSPTPASAVRRCHAAACRRAWVREHTGMHMCVHRKTSACDCAACARTPMRACLIAPEARAHGAVFARRSLDLQELLALSAPDDSGADLGEAARERGDVAGRARKRCTGASRGARAERTMQTPSRWAHAARHPRACEHAP